MLRFYLEILLFWKNPWYSSMIPVMTHSSPPMAESIPNMISMKKKMTDLRIRIENLAGGGLRHFQPNADFWLSRDT